jgi:DUF1680 family protein
MLKQLIACLLIMPATYAQGPIQPLPIKDVTINDAFWSPKLQTWTHKTVYDVFDKLEGHYDPDQQDLKDELAKTGHTRNAFHNFDLVAQGKKDIGTHDGPPWYDGLVYETIRGAADLLIAYPDSALERKIDGYITRIAAAQAADPNGYINTFTTLTASTHRWGTNGGSEVWQHDLYNSGMLAEAGVHYYRATGKTQLLGVAVKMADYIYLQMGPAPKQNIIPGHGGPEEAFINLYQLFQEQPALAKQLSASPDHYYQTALFWITDRGHYSNADSTWKRPDWGSYNQDQSPVFEQQTIEGHAVRATLLATGITTAALYNNDPHYIRTADRYWNNMVGKRMFITGGEGAIADQEKFGPDYYLPESAYLETCAAAGAAFFSERMNELKADGKYMDEFERVLYNNLLSGVSEDGTHYFYENPLVAKDHTRWAWHSCPCCPPMFLKMIGALPQYIYGKDKNSVYVNLFISSKASFDINGRKVNIEQRTHYPWQGTVEITADSPVPLKIRIPGWANGKENPFDLYRATGVGKAVVKIDGKPIPVTPVNGYVTMPAGKVITLELPVAPRKVYPNPAVKELTGKVAIAAGPVVYAYEHAGPMVLKANTLSTAYTKDMNVINGMFIPFYAVGNNGVQPYQVWMNEH